MTMMNLARSAIGMMLKDEKLREEENKAYIDFCLKNKTSGKLYRLANSIPEMISKIESKCESECKKCILLGNSCDGSIREIASCNTFKDRELVISALDQVSNEKRF